MTDDEIESPAEAIGGRRRGLRVDYKDNSNPLFDWRNTEQLKSEGPQAAEVIAENIHTLWDLTQDVLNIEAPKFGTKAIEFWRDDFRVDDSKLSDGEIAIAKLEYLDHWWVSLTTHPWQKKVVTYPPIAVIAELVDSQFSGVAFQALMQLDFDHEPYSAPDYVRSQLREIVAVLKPTMELFFASLRVKKVLEPKNARRDEPTEEEYRLFCQVRGTMFAKRPTIDGVRKEVIKARLKLSNSKISKLNRRFNEESTNRLSPPSPGDETT